MAWVIADAQDQDLPAVIAIEQESFHTPWSCEMLSAELGLPQSRFRVLHQHNPFATRPGMLCGFCISWVMADELHLLQIAVAPAFRRQGWGRILLQDAVEIARTEEVRQILLEVRASNHAAIHMYHSFRFQTVGVRRGYYSNPTEDAVVLVKENIHPSFLRM